MIQTHGHSSSLTFLIQENQGKRDPTSAKGFLPVQVDGKGALGLLTCPIPAPEVPRLSWDTQMTNFYQISPELPPPRTIR